MSAEKTSQVRQRRLGTHFYAIFAVAGFAIAGVGAQNYFEIEDFLANATRTNGEVIERASREADLLVVRFQVDREESRIVRLEGHRDSRLTVGDRVEVAYFSDEYDTQVRILDEWPPFYLQYGLLLSGVSLAIGGCAFVRIFRYPADLDGSSGNSIDLDHLV